MSRPDPGFEAALRRLSAEVAPDVLQEAVEESRREAVGILRARLTAAMVDEAERLIAGQEPRRAAPDAARAEPAGPPAAPTAPRAEPVPAGPVTGWYVYGLTWDTAARALEVDDGVDGAPVQVVTAGPLAGVVSPITTSEPWGIGPDGDVDLELLAPRARRHEFVLEQMLDRGAVVPFRFGVLYPDLDRLRALLSERAPVLADTLRRLENQSEWGLTVAVGDSGSTGTISPLPSTAGRDYLARRREERVAEDQEAEELARAAAGIHESLLEVVSEAVILPAGRSEGRTQKAVLRASYLVPNTAVDPFRTAAEAALTSSPSRLRLTGELTGPWPAYHFCDSSLEQVPA